MTIHVLFVDDEPRLLEGIRLALRRSGLTIHTAASGEDALAFLASRDVDVVVSDERMPGTQGSELLTQVYEAMPDTVRILLTGQATPEAAARAVNQARVHRFLTKPTSPGELFATIQELLAQRDAARGPGPMVAAPTTDERTSLLQALETDHPGIATVRREHGCIVLSDELDAL